MAAAFAVPLAVNGVAKMATSSASQAYLEGGRVKETKVLIAELCRQFYHLGWVSGTGGSITIKVHDDSIPKPQQLIVMSPSGTKTREYFCTELYELEFLWVSRKDVSKMLVLIKEYLPFHLLLLCVKIVIFMGKK